MPTGPLCFDGQTRGRLHAHVTTSTHQRHSFFSLLIQHGKTSLDDIATLSTPRDMERSARDATSSTVAAPADITAYLQPSSLPVARTQRGWERRPASPFSRRNIRVGRVWKCVVNSISSRLADHERSTSDAPATSRQPRDSRRAKALWTLGASPLQAVKKLCVDEGFGLRASVARWDERGSPARKIVTRSRGLHDKSLIALPELADVEGRNVAETDNATIEVLDENGCVMDAELGSESEAWSDVEDVNLVKDSKEDYSDGTTKPPEGAQTPNEASTMRDESIESHAVPEEQMNNADAQSTAAPSLALEKHSDNLASANVSVYAVERRRKLGPRFAREVIADRQRTLPQGVVSSIATPAVVTRAQTEVASRLDDRQVQNVGRSMENAPSAAIGLEHKGQALVEEDEWEDVHEVLHEQQAPEDVTVSTAVPVRTSARVTEDAHTDPSRAAMQAESVWSPPAPTCIARNEIAMDTVAELLPFSPLSTGDEARSHFSSRCSPRRQSPSPPERSIVEPSCGSSHSIGFAQSVCPSLHSHSSAAVLEGGSDVHSDSTDANHTTSDELREKQLDHINPLIERAASAPPEERRRSPQKLSRPRISDDTALLQAFLSRAAENKGSQSSLSTAARRESITNRRDSDAVRQALASPVKAADVLGDLDPNSPSPRKSSAVDGSTVNNTGTTSIEVSPQDVHLTKNPASNGTRRSGRVGRQKAQMLAQTPHAPGAAPPNKITIRGPAVNGVAVATKTEAQALAALTRRNTHKNKDGAVLPLCRLAELAEEGFADGCSASGVSAVTAPEGADVMLDIAEAGTKRAVRWAETLASFSDAYSVELEASELSEDAGQGQLHVSAVSLSEAEATETSLPRPAETPSKPKQKPKALEAAKRAATATVDAEAPTMKAITDSGIEQPNPMRAAAVEPANDECQPASAPPSKPRRSRIATPAKDRLINKPTDVAADPLPTILASIVPPGSAERTSTPATTRRKRTAVPATSKLPAPTTVPSTASSSSLDPGMTGNKNSVLAASPAKKRAPAAKAFAPKLDLEKAAGGHPQFAPPFPGSAALANSGPGGHGADVPALASPPKKKAGRSRGAAFGHGAGETVASVVGGVGGVAGDKTVRETPPAGLSSPAKKRTRRGGTAM